MNLKTYGIESLSTDHLKANELSQLTADSAAAALAFVTEHKGEHLLATHANRLQTAQADFQAVQKGKVASNLVKELEEADQKRDRSYQTLVNFVKSYAYGQPENTDLQPLKAQLNTIRKRYKGRGGKKVEQ